MSKDPPAPSGSFEASLSNTIGELLLTMATRRMDHVVFAVSKVSVHITLTKAETSGAFTEIVEDFFERLS